MVLKKGSFVLKLSTKISNNLKPFCKKIIVAGSIRRRVKAPGDIDIVLIPKDRKKIFDLMNKKGKFLQGGQKRDTFRIDGVKVELYFTTPESWGATLFAYSSESGAAIGLRMVAKRKGLHLNQYGLFKNGKYLAGKTEQDIYKALGRPYKKPENR